MQKYGNQSSVVKAGGSLSLTPVCQEHGKWGSRRVVREKLRWSDTGPAGYSAIEPVRDGMDRGYKAEKRTENAAVTTKVPL
jgi:hypothetical protein